MDKTRWNEIQAVILFAVAILIFVSLVSFDFSDLAAFTSRPNHPVRNFAGLVGAYLGACLFFVMGYSAYVIPLLMLSWAVARFYGVTPQKMHFKLFGTFFLVLASSALFSIIAIGEDSFRFKLGGIVGLVFSDFLVTYLGRFGAIVVIAVLFLLSILLATEFLLLPFLTALVTRASAAAAALKGKIFKKKEIPVYTVKPGAPYAPSGARPTISKQTKDTMAAVKTAQAAPAQAGATGAKAESQKKEAAETVRVSVPDAEAPAAQAPKVAPPPYRLPGLDLLDSPPPIEARKIKEDFDANARILEETLKDFEIDAKVVEINRGPVITRYELEPAPGVKVHRITSLSDNIALAMKAQSVRIVAPIPGKGTIGVEVPNPASTLVYLKEVLDSKEFKESRSKLKLALGKDIAGAPVIADLASMPHLLIAGATGSGKTVCLNSLITTLLLDATPEEVRFIMIDPKRVELATFNNLPHLLSPVVTEAKKVSAALDWVVGKMESRFDLFAQAGVRNIDAYNEKVVKERTTHDARRTTKLPYIIVIIDELADLMMVAQGEVEAAITRLAQLSRAVGIHIIIATQRPSVDVITGVIKANFPARISFKVASKVDSRTVLDMNGADKLLGRGDMLFIEPGAARPVRAQCSLISDKEIERITNFIRAQREPAYEEDILEGRKAQTFKKFEKDEVYEEAVKLVLETRQASVSLLQRRLGLGYTRAARLIDMMEDDGVVGPYQGSKPRDILMTLEEYQAKDGN
jgi:S-DNA-T family DNA segregation ATPase FtsK/SpoIIIE